MMKGSETNGLALYQQTVNQTPGVVSSTWVQSTSGQPVIVVQIVPTQIEKKDEESLKEKTA